MFLVALTVLKVDFSRIQLYDIDLNVGRLRGVT